MNDLRSRYDVSARNESRLRKCSPERKRALCAASHSDFCAALLQSGMNPSELATYVGCSRQYVHEMMKGSRPVQLWIFRALLDVIDGVPSSVTGTHG